MFDSTSAYNIPECFKNPAAGIKSGRRRKIAAANLLDLDKGRLESMDAAGVDMHLLSLGLPGVQLFEADQARGLARLSNDRLSDAIRRHPTRFAGLACFASSKSREAVREMERSINTLKLNGFLVNSHTGNGYLDEQPFWPILEAAEALGAPLSYPSSGPFRRYGRPFPRLPAGRSDLGVWHRSGHSCITVNAQRSPRPFPEAENSAGAYGRGITLCGSGASIYGSARRTAGRGNQLKPSEYFKRNFSITTSGVEDPLCSFGFVSISWVSIL